MQVIGADRGRTPIRENKLLYSFFLSRSFALRGKDR